MRLTRRQRSGAPHRGADMWTCRHTWKDSDGTERAALGTVYRGVVCSECGMLLTWDEVAEYMRGENACD
jgi:hypothetical protein